MLRTLLSNVVQVSVAFLYRMTHQVPAYSYEIRTKSLCTRSLRAIVSRTLPVKQFQAVPIPICTTVRQIHLERTVV